MFSFIALIAILCSAFFPLRGESLNANAIRDNDLACQKAAQERSLLLSSDDLIRCYYNDYVKSTDYSVDYGSFKKNYLSHGLRMDEYTDYLIKRCNSPEWSFESDFDDAPERSSSDGDADYIILCSESAQNNGYGPLGENTPIPYNRFKSKADGTRCTPLYGYYFDYSVFELCDIVVETQTIFWNAGHTAVVVDTSREYKDSNNNVKTLLLTIEAVGSGVKYGYLDDERIMRYGVNIYRAYSIALSTYCRSQIIDFLKYQLYKPYSLDIFRRNYLCSSSEWYCSELTWAAFYAGGYDLGICQGQGAFDPMSSSGILPFQFSVADNDYHVTLGVYLHLSLAVVIKTGSVWTIRIANSSSSSRTVYYNSKMCFESDAKNWTGLYDINTITIGPHSYANVNISENWFAGYITCSYLGKAYDSSTNSFANARLVTYANQLNGYPASLSEKTNIIWN